MERLLFLLAVLLMPLESYSESKRSNYFDTNLAWNVIKQSASTVPDDLYNIAATPFKNPAQTLGYLGLIGGLVAVDKEVTTFYQQEVENHLDFYSLPTIIYDSAITRGADSWIVFGSIAHYLGGFAFSDEKSQVTSLMAMKAMTYSYGISHVLLKSITGRNRPKDDLKNCKGSKTHTCDPFDFGNARGPVFSSDQKATALPSFHVTMYFSTAKIYQEMYDSYLIPYSALAIIFASDIKGHQHWVSDMVTGGIIGTFIGSQIVSSYRDKNDESSGFSLVPVRGGGLGVSYSYDFK